LGSFSSSSNGTAKLFATLIVLPMSWPSSTPTTRFRALMAMRDAWSVTDKSTSGCTTTDVAVTGKGD